MRTRLVTASGKTRMTRVKRGYTRKQVQREKATLLMRSNPREMREQLNTPIKGHQSKGFNPLAPIVQMGYQIEGSSKARRSIQKPSLAIFRP